MPYWLSTPAMDLSIEKSITTRDLRGIQYSGYVFAAKRSCILSCPLPASRVFSQPPLLARSRDLVGACSSSHSLPRELANGLPDTERPHGSLPEPSNSRFDPKNATLEIWLVPTSSEVFIDHTIHRIAPKNSPTLGLRLAAPKNLKATPPPRATAPKSSFALR